MRIIFTLNTFIIFQNKSDQKIFSLSKKKTKIIHGSGFDKNKFKYQFKRGNKKFVFLMVARMIKHKGINEYVEAAKIIKKKNHDKVEFYLIFSKDNSFFGYPENKIKEYKKYINFLRFSKKNYLKYLKLSDCFVLPSYREGFSKTILEASSMGCLVLATNVPGCRDIILNKKTGILCMPKSLKSLIFNMNYVRSLDKSKRDKISFAGHLRVNENFSTKKVNQEYYRIIKKLI